MCVSERGRERRRERGEGEKVNRHREEKERAGEHRACTKMIWYRKNLMVYK